MALAAGLLSLCLTLIILLGRPRIVVYNIPPNQLRQALDAAARRLDSDTIWAGKALSMPLARVHLHVENFPPLGNVALLATGDEQSATGWHRLEVALRRRSRKPPWRCSHMDSGCCSPGR